MGSARQRRLVASCAATSVAAVGAFGVTAGSASAAPTPVVQEFNYSFGGATFSGDPWPFSFEALQATTGVKSGVVRLSAGDLCNVFVPTLCAGYSFPINVTWINFGTGRSGFIHVTDQGVDIDTGPGPVGLSGQIDRYPIFPNLGLVNA